MVCGSITLITGGAINTLQRALGANLKTARSGILFAAFLKLLIPVIAVIPGITMFVMHINGMFHQEMMDVNGIVKPGSCLSTLYESFTGWLERTCICGVTAAIVASLREKQTVLLQFFH